MASERSEAAVIAAAFKAVSNAKAEISSAVDRLAKSEDFLDKLRPNDASTELLNARAALERAIDFCNGSRTDR